ncbi:MAG: TIGR01212 family radical SAM protein [Eubacteriales bacterium]|nr:TIGR01212 family radical SAM protein [Eubacteriales bacterium]
MDWNNKPYHSLDFEMKRRFGTKVYKLALDGGMTCPNRDGTLGSRGCIFCSAGGSGDFAASCSPELLYSGIEKAISRISGKMRANPGAYIAYFQSYTNTYAPVSYLEQLFSAAISHPQIVALSIATRPDCLSDEILGLLSALNEKKPVWVELGLQTIHEDTAAFIRRGYPLSCFSDSLDRLQRLGLETIVHVILGLPGEDRARMLQTVSWLSDQQLQGIKLQLLHVLEGTDLAALYRQDPFPVMTLEEYADLICDCISLLPPGMVVHRITGDGPKPLLIAPLWSANKRLVLNTITRRLKERHIFQGCCRT